MHYAKNEPHTWNFYRIFLPFMSGSTKYAAVGHDFLNLDIFATFIIFIKNEF